MWPELLKQLRSGLVFNPLDELQKRATQYGTGIGENLQAQHAQAGYAKTHPKSQRAQTEALSNAVMLALSIWKPVEGVAPEHLAKINKALPETVIAPAMANKKSGLFNTGLMHYDAVPGLIRGGGGDPDVKGWLTSLGRIVSDAQAYKIKKGELSPAVKAQIATRAEQSGKAPKLTSEDFRGKLTANRGTRADPPMTLADMERIMAEKKARGGPAPLDSIVSRVPLSTLLSRVQARRENVAQNWGENRRPFADRVADQEKIAGNAAAYKARLNPTAAPVSPEETQIGANAAAYKARKLPPGADSVISKLPAILQGKNFQNDVDKRLRGALWETALRDEKKNRAAERASAQTANATDYPISKDSRAALRRGDKQRRTGIAQDSVIGRIVGSITPRGSDGLTDAQRAAAWDNRGKLAGSIAPKSGKDPGGMFALPEKTGVEAPPIHGNLAFEGSGIKGYIQPGNVDEAHKLSIRNQVSKDIEKTSPSKPGLSLLDSIVDPAALRGYGRAITARDQRLDEFRKVDSTWNVAYNAWKSIAKQAHDEPTTRRMELADALRGGPKPPKGIPSLMGHYQDPEYIPTVEAVKYAKRLPQQFKQMIEEAQKAGNLFYNGEVRGLSTSPSRTERSKAIDIEIAARNVVKQAQAGVFVPPHATPAEAATIIGHGKQVAAGLHKINPDIWAALEAAMKAARFLHLKD